MVKRAGLTSLNNFVCYQRPNIDLFNVVLIFLSYGNKHFCSVLGLWRRHIKLHLCSYFATLMLIICVYMYAKSLQSCLTLCNPMNCSPSGSSVHGILQARIQSGLPFPSPGDLPNPGIKLMSLIFAVLAGGFFTTSTTWM